MENIKARFSNEVGELLEGLESNLLALESHGQNPEIVSEIFRVVHTIKGTASMFGFTNMGVLTHDIEDLYDLVRSDKILFDKELLDLSFKTLDLLKEMLKSDDSLSEKMKLAFDDILQASKTRLNSFEGSFIQSNANTLVQANSDSILYYIRYQPDSDVLSRGIDPLSILEEMDEEGQLMAFLDLATVPSLDAFNPEKFFLAWDIFYYGANDSETVEDIFLFFLSHEYSIQSFKISNINSEFFYKDVIERIKAYGISPDNLSKSLISLCGNNVQENTTQIEDSNSIKASEIGKETNDTIRIDSSKLDELINLVSDLVTLNGQLELKAEALKDHQLEKQISQLNKLTKRFRDNARNMRLVPVSILTTKMQRLVRDLSSDLNKKVEFITEGINTELDKSIINRLEGPIMHIIRNSLDHAIEEPADRIKTNKPETGVIRFIAFHSGGNVFIQIQDDGNGIDADKIKAKAIEKGIIQPNTKLSQTEVFNLIFEPGFSTAETVSNVSGRGVGLDTVKKQIADMRGQVDVESEIGLGTSITLKLPLTLSIIDTLETTIANNKVLIPMEFIVKTTFIENESVRHISFEKEIIPVLPLRSLFGQESISGVQKAVIIRHYDKLYAITVDNIERAHQAVVKPMGVYNRHHPYFSGSSIMGDGSLSFILDINRLIKHQKHRN